MTPFLTTMVFVFPICTAGSFPGRMPSIDICWTVTKKSIEETKNTKTSSAKDRSAFGNAHPPKRRGSTHMIWKVTYKNIQHSFGNPKNGNMSARALGIFSREYMHSHVECRIFCIHKLANLTAPGQRNNIVSNGK